MLLDLGVPSQVPSLRFVGEDRFLRFGFGSMWIRSRNRDPGFFNMGLVRSAQGMFHPKIMRIRAKMAELWTPEVLRKLWNFFLATLSTGEKKGPLIRDQHA